LASIADVFRDRTSPPETSRIAAGIERALRDVDVRATAKRWGREIEQGLGEPTVDVKADTTPAKRDIERLEKEKHTTAHIKVEVDQAA
jgi:hypothetical protein